MKIYKRINKSKKNIMMMFLKKFIILKGKKIWLYILVIKLGLFVKLIYYWYGLYKVLMKLFDVMYKL